MKAPCLMCVCLRNSLPCLYCLSSHQMQQVSVQPSTDNGLCPTGSPSSRSSLAWLTRTHLAPRPWPRGKRPVWISSNSCWPGPTQIWVRDTLPKVSIYLSARVTMCTLAQSTCLPFALVLLFISQLLASLSFCSLSSFTFSFPCALLLLTLSLFTLPASCAVLLTMLWAGKSSSHLDMQITRGKNTSNNKSKWQAFVLPKRQAFIVYPTPETVCYPWHPSGHGILADLSLYS